jgi:hypothetical protein
MTPSYAVKKGRRYGYYVSRPLITQDLRKSSTALRVPAAEIEHLVTSRVRQWLLDPGGIYQSTRLPDPSAQHRLLTRAVEIGTSWIELPGTRQRAFLTTLIDRIDVGADQIDIHLRPGPGRRTPRCRNHLAAERNGRRNSNLVRVGAVTPLRAGDQDVDRGDRPVCHSKT